ncbi:MAG TPA: hypothetical protein VLQ48_11380 [Chloroflexia bacterium]|jgi:hypothetical protein|nr:hypothetical protein [Chloroflexia bacterium]
MPAEKSGKVYYRAARRPRSESGTGPGYEERISWIQGDLIFEDEYVRAVAHGDETGDRARTYDFVIPWHSILYIEMDTTAAES